MADNPQDERFQRWLPISTYQDVPGGPGVGNSGGLNQANFEGAKSTALDGTKQRLRDPNSYGSPFTIRLRAPDTLLEALSGNNYTSPQTLFDPILQEQYRDAETTFNTVLNNPNASSRDIALAREAFLGSVAPPSSGQNLGVVDAATRVNNNFAAYQQRQVAARGSNYFAVGSPTQRQATLGNLSNLITSNGVQFNPQNANFSDANQTAVADLTQAVDVVRQLNIMLNTPPLTLMVNPNSFSIQYKQKQNYNDRSRYDYIYDAWGEEQVSLSISGRSAGFVVGTQGAAGGNTQSVSGYQYVSKLDSAGWQNLMSLFMMYRNNGYIYDLASSPQSEAHLFVGNVEIAYDQMVYVGNFESFGYNYNESKQHGAIDFDFKFTVSFMFDTSQTTEVEQQRSPYRPSPSRAQQQQPIPDQSTTATRSVQREEPTESSTAILDNGSTPDLAPTANYGTSRATGLLGREGFDPPGVP